MIPEMVSKASAAVQVQLLDTCCGLVVDAQVTDALADPESVVRLHVYPCMGVTHLVAMLSEHSTGRDFMKDSC